MYAMTNTSAGERLLAILNEKGVSQAELARLSGRSKPAISDVISGRRNMSAEFATDLAMALVIPPELFFREMGLLPPSQPETAQTKELAYLASEMPPTALEDVLEFARHRLRLAEKRGEYEPKKTKQNT